MPGEPGEMEAMKGAYEGCLPWLGVTGFTA